MPIFEYVCKECQYEFEALVFGKRKAEKLDVVGKGLGWLDAIDRSHLPSALRTLYWLARLERPTLRDLLADGTIHPGMSEREGRELLVKFQGLRENPRKVNVRQRLQRFANFVRETVSDWNFEEREEAKTELSRLIEHFESWPSLAAAARLTTSRGAALDEFSWRVAPRFTCKPNQPE